MQKNKTNLCKMIFSIFIVIILILIGHYIFNYKKSEKIISESFNTDMDIDSNYISNIKLNSVYKHCIGKTETESGSPEVPIQKKIILISKGFLDQLHIHSVITYLPLKPRYTSSDYISMDYSKIEKVLLGETNNMKDITNEFINSTYNKEKNHNSFQLPYGKCSFLSDDAPTETLEIHIKTTLSNKDIQPLIGYLKYLLTVKDKSPDVVKKTYIDNLICNYDYWNRILKFGKNQYYIY